MKAIELLKEFIESPNRVSWLYGDDLHVYVRKSKRRIKSCGPHLVNVLDIASIESCNPGKGFFAEFFPLAHAMNPWAGTFVENVLNPEFGKHLIKKQGMESVVFDGICHSYFLKK